jgi:hypothetical protein
MLYHPSAIPDEAAEALQPAFDRSDMAEVSDWIELCKKDQAQLWRLNDYWVMTQVMDTKKGRAVHLAYSAGVYEPGLVTEIENWARGKGCKLAYFSGRPGTQRRRPDYRLRYITMDKEL